MHEQSYNTFYVVDGKLGVKTDKGYTSIIHPGESFTVEPGVYHEFQTYDKLATIVEVAYTKYDTSDIKRAALGGSLPDEETNE